MNAMLGKFIARLGLWQVGNAPISYPLPPCLPHTRQDKRQTEMSGHKSQLHPNETQDLSWKLNSQKTLFLLSISFASQTEISFLLFDCLKSSLNFVSDHVLQDFCQPLRARRRCLWQPRPPIGRRVGGVCCGDRSTRSQGRSVGLS